MTQGVRTGSTWVVATMTLCVAASLVACSRNAEPQPAVSGEAATAPDAPVAPAGGDQTPAAGAAQPSAGATPPVQPAAPAQGLAATPDPATLSTCEAVAAAYAALVANRSCTADTECQLLGGSCSSGLGGCSEPVNRSVTQAQLGALAQRWEALHCIAGACRCAQPGTAACQNGLCDEVRIP